MKEYQYTYTDLKTGNVYNPTIAPADYNKLTRNYDRSKVYHGISRMYTGSQKIVDVDGEAFDSSGYWFIRNIWDRDKIKGQIQFERKKRNPFTNVYEADLVAIVNFTPEAGFTIDETEGSIEFSLIDSSKLQHFFSNDEKIVDIFKTTAINGNIVPDFVDSPKPVLFTPIDLKLEAISTAAIDWFTSAQTETTDQEEIVKDVVINNLGDRFKVVDQIRIYENTTDNTISLQLQVALKYTLVYNFSAVNFNNSGSIRMKIIARAYNSSDGFIDSFIYSDDFTEVVDIPTSGTTEIPLSGSANRDNYINIPAGGYINFEATYTTTNFSGGMAISIDLDSDITTLDFFEQYDSINTPRVESFLTHECAQRLIQLTTGETDTSKLLESNIFGRIDSEFQAYTSDGDLSYLATTSIKRLRRYPNSPCAISFKDWFKTIDYMGNIAFWYDKQLDKFKIEEKEQVYKDQLTLDLGVVSDLKIRPSKDNYFSQLMTGTREKGDYEEVQGAFEYNIEAEHSINLPVKDKLELRVPYNIDSLTMEFARRLPYYITGQTDTRQDRKIAIVKVDDSYNTVVNGTTYSGFISIEQFYNGEYTPRSCLRRSSNIISGIFENEDDSFTAISFRKNSKDIDITYPAGYAPAFVNEQKDLTKSELRTPLFYPIIYEFDFKIDYEGIKAIETDPHGYYRFESERGEVFNGYMLTCEVNDYEGKGKGTFIKANIDR